MLLRLDTSRNQLLVVDTVLSVGMLAVGLGAYVGSIFGMNLNSGLEEGDFEFQAVAIVTSVGMIAFVIFVINFFQSKGVIPTYTRISEY